MSPRPSPSTAPNVALQNLVITRAFAAPRALVFTAWTDPRHVAQWWGPHGFTTTVETWEARPGGAYLLRMHGPDGAVYPLTGTFEDVVVPERLVFTGRVFMDEGGHPQLEIRHSITLTEQDGATTLTLQATVITALPGAATALSGMEAGWRQSLDRLASHLDAPTPS